MDVYVVLYSNYQPAEVAAIYRSETEAEKHEEALNERDDSMAWRTVPWTVRDEFTGLDE